MQIRSIDNRGSLKITGKIDIYCGDELRETLAAHLSDAPGLKLDLSEVEECDLVGIQLICSARKSADQANKPFEVSLISPAVSKICEAIGLAPVSLSKTLVSGS